MADATTLKEFLVELGFKVDGNSERKFKESVNNASKVVGTLAVAMAAAATALAATVAKVAQGFDDIYFAARRTQTSVQGIQSLSYAVSQLGGSYQGARQSIESFAQRLRTNPGYESMVRGLGVATRDANGQLRQSSDILLDIGQQLGKRPYYVANQYAGALGIDETTLQALLSGEIGGRVNEYNSRIQRLGVDLNEAAKAGNALMDAWRGWDATLDAVKAKLEATFGRQFADAIRQFDEFVQKHAPDIETAFRKAGDAAEFFGGEIRDAFGRIDGAIEKLDKMIAKLTGTGGLQEALDGIGKWIDDTWVVRILKAFGLLEQGWYHLLTSIASAAVPGGFLLGGAPNPGRWVAEQMFGPGGGQQAPGGAEPPGIMGGNIGADIAHAQTDAIGRVAASGGEGGFFGGLVEGAKGAVKKAWNWIAGDSSSGQIKGLSEKAQDEYSNRLGNAESGNNYGQPGNQYGFRGRWQMGGPALADAGYVKPGTSNNGLSDPSNWTGKDGLSSLDDFLANKDGGQDKAFANFTSMNYDRLRKAGIITDGMPEEQVAGWLAVAHLKGVGGAIQLSRGVDNFDGNGTAASSYYRMMRGLQTGDRAPLPVQAPAKDQHPPIQDIKIDPKALDTIHSLNTLRADDASSAAALMPAPSVTNNATSFAPSTSIVVNGANDPQATADAVSSSQRGVNANLMRSFQGATR